MDTLKKSAEIYSDYIDYDYTFELDCDIDVTVAFRASNFYHLIGLHYLTDIAQLDRTRVNNSNTSIYKKILNGRISQDLIAKSDFYHMISERISQFSNLGDIISSKFIVDFDYTKLPKTDLLSKYLLYKQYENGYAILGLRYDWKNNIYVPETFIFEHTDYYIKDQVSYNVVDVKINHYRKKLS